MLSNTIRIKLLAASYRKREGRLLPLEAFATKRAYWPFTTYKFVLKRAPNS